MFVVSGDWHAEPTLLWDKPRLQMLYECLLYKQSGRDYREAPILYSWKEDIAAGRYSRTKAVLVDSVEKAEQIVDEYLQVFENILANGYDTGIVQASIGAAVDRHGNLLKAQNGRHRLAAAQLARVPGIPVAIRHVHADWLAEQLQRHSRIPLRAVIAGLKDVQARYNRQLSAQEITSLPIPEPPGITAR